MTSNLFGDLIHSLSPPENVYFDINIIKIETVLAEICYILFCFAAFSAILKIRNNKNSTA